MKSQRCFSVRILTGLAVMAGLLGAIAEDGNGLLLPFPPGAAGEGSAPVSPAPVPGRTNVEEKDSKHDETLRALEIAETFLHRQQMEVSNSVPVRGAPSARPPVRNQVPSSPAGTSAIAARKTEALAPEMSGPSSELLPLPGDDAPGQPLESLLPDPSAILPGGDTGTPPADSPAETAVPRGDLAPAPAYGGVEDQDRRGPVFRVGGAEAFKLARARGFKFTPAGGFGSRDGSHTAASQFPNVLTSEVHGTRMSQLRPPPGWSVSETSNTFFMFCDAGYNAVRLTPGWRIRGIKLEGANWAWVACPRSGANTASFSVRVYSFKNQENPGTSVQLAGLTLEGPEGATDWREAFPSLNGRGLPPVPSRQPAPREDPASLAKTPSKGAEPPLPE